MPRPDFDVLDTSPDSAPNSELEVFVFMDTEFSSFDHPELLSIGLVAEATCDELYIEIDGAQELAVTEFVEKAVFPLFGMCTPEVLAYGSVADRIEAWFDELRAGEKDSRVVLLTDSSYDWMLFSELKVAMPGQLPWTRAINVCGRLIQHNVENGRHWQAFLEEIEKYHLRAGIRHHALIDARAMKYAFSASQSSE